MNKRTTSHFKEIASHILTILDKNELSFREIAWNLHEDEKELSNDIKTLVADGVIARKFHHHNVMYTRAYHMPFIQILHKLERKLK